MTDLDKAASTVSRAETNGGSMCPKCGARVDIRRGGRPRREIDVPSVLDAYARLQNVRATAREVGLPAGTAWHALNRAGVLERRPPSDSRAG
jgi:hypothetical protein